MRAKFLYGSDEEGQLTLSIHVRSDTDEEAALFKVFRAQKRHIPGYCGIPDVYLAGIGSGPDEHPNVREQNLTFAVRELPKPPEPLPDLAVETDDLERAEEIVFSALRTENARLKTEAETLKQQNADAAATFRTRLMSEGAYRGALDAFDRFGGDGTGAMRSAISYLIAYADGGPTLAEKAEEIGSSALRAENERLKRELADALRYAEANAKERDSLLGPLTREQALRVAKVLHDGAWTETYGIDWEKLTPSEQESRLHISQKLFQSLIHAVRVPT